MIKIREKENGYGFIVVLLIIIIMVLISYIAYNKGLGKQDGKTTTTTPKTTTTETLITNKEFTYDNICNESTKCSDEITTIDDLKIKIESDENKHQILLTGLVDKTIELEKFISLRVINNEYYIIKSTEKEHKESYILTLYDSKFNKLDKLDINIYKKETYDNLNLTYFTYDIKCTNDQDDYFLKETAIISNNGFEITSSNKGPLKTEGTICKKITTN